MAADCIEHEPRLACLCWRRIS